MDYLKPGSSLVDERRAPIEKLSSAKKRALVACLEGDGTLHRCHGAWSPDCDGGAKERIFGMTVADLIRDGMLALSTTDRRAPARLTPLGNWYAQTATNDLSATRSYRILADEVIE
jgi:hypothetical protein